MPISTMPSADMVVLRAAKDLANLTASATADDVNRVLAQVWGRHRKASSSHWNLVTPGLMPAVESDLAFLRAGLERIRNDGRPPVAKHTEYLRQVAGAVALLKVPRGGLQLALTPEFTGVGSVVGYALGLLIDRRYDARRRLGKCRECGAWFFDDHTGPGRFRTEFCSTAHNDAHAQRAKRERDKAARNKQTKRGSK